MLASGTEKPKYCVSVAESSSNLFCGLRMQQIGAGVYFAEAPVLVQEKRLLR